jgi:hypothetical protein
MTVGGLSCGEYTARVLHAYRTTLGTTGSVRKPDRQLAADLFRKGVPLAAVENALALAAVRRQIRPAGAAPLPLARSLAYFLPVIEEVQHMEVNPDYFDYVRRKMHELNRNIGGPAKHATVDAGASTSQSAGSKQHGHL